MTKNNKISRKGFLKLGAATVAGSLILSNCGTDEPAPSTGPYLSSVDSVSLRLLWTADTHGHIRPVYHREPLGEDFLKNNGIESGSIEAYLTTSVDYENLAKQYGKVGGLARLATLINQERDQYPESTILLDSGDTWYGSGIALLTEMKAPVEAMNAMGYDAMTLHWEFNMGSDIFLDRVDQANFNILAQNLVDTDFEDRILEPSMIKEIGGSGNRIAIVAEAYPFSMLTTEDREAISDMRMGYRDLELQEEITRVRTQEGADIVILLSHMGYPQDRAMAINLTGVDVIVGGHTHDILWQPEIIGETILLQGGSHGKFLGELDLEIKDGKILGFDHQLLPVLAEQIEPDSEVKSIIDRHYEPYEDMFAEEIAESDSTLYRASLFGGTTDAYMGQAYREIVGSELACTPGWRFGSTLLPGIITIEDVYNCMKPTASPLYTSKLNGNTIKLTIEDNLDNVFNPDPLQQLGGYAVRCTGIESDYIKDAPRIEKLVDPKANGEPIEDKRIYTVATSGGRTQTRDPESEQTERTATEELVEYIKNNSPITDIQPINSFHEV